MVTQFPTENPPLATVNTHLLRLCRDLQCHCAPSLTCPKPTGRTEGNPACKPSNGSAVPGGPSVQAALLSPEIGESWLSRRLSVPGRRKCTRPAVVAGGYHRGQRTGHVRTGVTRELGRASCFSAHESRKMRGPSTPHPLPGRDGARPAARFGGRRRGAGGSGSGGPGSAIKGRGSSDRRGRRAPGPRGRGRTPPWPAEIPACRPHRSACPRTRRRTRAGSRAGTGCRR